MQTEVIMQLLKKPKPIRNAKLGLKQYLHLTVIISNGFGLFQQLNNYNLSLHFTTGLQFAFYSLTDCSTHFGFFFVHVHVHVHIAQ